MKRITHALETGVRAVLADAALASVEGGAFDTTRFDKLTQGSTQVVEDGNDNTDARLMGYNGSIAASFKGADAETVGGVIGAAQQQRDKDLGTVLSAVDSKPSWLKGSK